MGRRIAIGLIAYAALLLLLQELGQVVLDLLWTGVGALVQLATEAGSRVLATVSATSLEPFFTIILGLVALGLASLGRYLVWPLIAESSRTAPPDQQPRARPTSAAEVVEIPSAHRKRADKVEQREAA